MPKYIVKPRSVIWRITQKSTDSNLAVKIILDKDRNPKVAKVHQISGNIIPFSGIQKALAMTKEQYSSKLIPDETA